MIGLLDPPGRSLPQALEILSLLIRPAPKGLPPFYGLFISAGMWGANYRQILSASPAFRASTATSGIHSHGHRFGLRTDTDETKMEIVRTTSPVALCSRTTGMNLQPLW